MAGRDSHLGKFKAPSKVVGLGLDETEMEAKHQLSEPQIYGLNTDLGLQFPDNLSELF